MFIYCGYKSIIPKVITSQIPHGTESEIIDIYFVKYIGLFLIEKRFK
jgi:hypothetical protein